MTAADGDGRSTARLVGAVDERGVASVELFVGGPGGRLTVPCMIDTGFTGWVVLPAATVGQLGLRQTGQSAARLADGTRVVLARYRAEMDWMEGRRLVHVYSTPGSRALIGARLLAQHRLVIDYPRRTVEISASA